MLITEIHPRDIGRIWPTISPLVESALKKADGWGEADLIDALLAGDMLLLAVQLSDDPGQGEIDAVLFLRALRWPKYTALEVSFAGAKSGIDITQAMTNQTALNKLKAIAERIGAHKIQAWMRPGLAKAAKAGGWKKTAELMEL